jgi:UDP-N-acetylglucosamine--dolichyl-phosphate N-acetylglucosaminephosphotransferase
VYHTYLTILIPAIVAFAVTVIATLFIKGYMLESGVISIDHNKKNKPIVPSSGGVAVAFGFASGLLVYIFGASFPTPAHPFYIPVASLTYIYATILAVILIALGGLLDDINVKGKMEKATGMKDIRKGLKQWQKPLLSLIGALPLMAVNAGNAFVDVPFIGMVNFGIFYPLVIIPLAVIFAANAFNLLGGFDGIAGGSALVMMLGFLVYGALYGSYIGTLIAAVTIAALIAFLALGAFAKKNVLPGDSFSYAIGAIIVALMIVGNMEAFGIIVFIPWFIEFILHARKRFDVTDLGTLQKDGTFKPPYGRKIYSWTHLIMNFKRCKEWEVSLYMWLIEAGFVVLAFALKFVHLLV